MAELSALAKAGKPLYGESDLPEYMQGVAHRNSVWSQLKFGTLPWYENKLPRRDTDTQLVSCLGLTWLITSQLILSKRMDCCSV